MIAADPSRTAPPGALVVGGSRGIGLAIAERLALDGHRVAVAARDPDPAVRRLRRPHGAEVTGIRLDLAAEDAAGAVRRAVDAFGRVDVLVYAAGRNLRRPLLDVDLDEWQAVQRVNVEGAFLAARACAAGMIGTGHGRMLFVSSVLADLGGFNAPVTAYTTSKSALQGLVRGLAYELGPHGVTVNAIAPGYVRTELTRALWAEPETARRVAERTRVGRWGEPADVAGLAAFLCSDQAGYVTGQVHRVDGGFSIA